jgi:hypothetical protein
VVVGVECNTLKTGFPLEFSGSCGYQSERGGKVQVRNCNEMGS